jgi:hypothetical protein
MAGRSQPLDDMMTSSQHVYEIRPRKDKRGVDLISDVLPFGFIRIENFPKSGLNWVSSSICCCSSLSSFRCAPERGSICCPGFSFNRFDPTSEALPFERLWYLDAGAALSYAKFYLRSHPTTIRVYDESGAVLETHESAGDFRES